MGLLLYEESFVGQQPFFVAVYPLDFKEYMWANGIQQSTFDYLKECYDNASRVSDTVHETLSKLFYSYLVVGGMPENVFAQNLRAGGL